MQDGTPFCFSCGIPDIAAAETCPHCTTPTGIDTPERLDPASIQIGRVRHRGQKLEVLAFKTESASRLVAADGQEILAKGQLNRTFRRVHGLEDVGSMAAALLLARTQLMEGPAEQGNWKSLITSIAAGRVQKARRAAIALSAAGVPALIKLLPLSDSEQTWWTCIAHVRRGDASLAAAAIRTLPPMRYPDALPLLASLSREQRGHDRIGAAGETLDALDPAAWIELLQQSASWNPSAVDDRWLYNPALTPSASPAGQAAELLATATGSERTLTSPLHVPASTPIAIIDDLVDREIAFEVTGLDAVPEADRLYITARTEPATLEHRELTTLKFDDEIVRRQLFKGEPVTLDASSAVQPLLREAAEYTVSWEVGVPTSWSPPSNHTAIRRLIESPSPDSLTREALRDHSLWPYLQRALPLDASSWTATRGSIESQYLAWCALRNATSRLYDARWDDAATEARQVLRLTDDESLRDEALNVIAFTCWQAGNDDAAQKALTSALEGSRNVALQVNLGIIAADLAPEAAALELARLVRESSTLELRAAAALRAT